MSQSAHLFETTISKPLHLDYLLSTPASYGADPAKRWPLILFLHGAGERGDDVERLKVNGIPKVVERGDDLPFITVSPQCPERSNWLFQFDALDGLLGAITETHAVDLDRVYLTGLSMGGNGTWHFATAFPRRFAAIAAVCGWGDWWHGFPEAVCALKEVPVWAFHGAKDDVVPLQGSEVLVDALRECGGDVRLTVYPEAEHDSWTETYDNPELYRWFLSHRRPEAWR